MSSGRRWFCLWSLVWLAAPVSGFASDTVMCVDPESEKQVPISIAGLQNSVYLLKDRVEQGDFHVLDLGPALQSRRRRLMEDLEKKNWCIVRSHVLNLHDEFEGLVVDSEFVSEKFRRLERWYRHGTHSSTRASELRRVLGEAVDAMSSERNDVANRNLNRALGILFGGTRWTLPSAKKLAVGAKGGVSEEDYVEIFAYEVESGCPDLVGKDPATLNTVVDELQSTFGERSLRPLDLPEGELLMDDFKGYYSLGALWPSIRVLCVMKERASNVEIGLASIVRRFRNATRLYQEMELSKKERKQFLILIREASTKLGNREYQSAHKILEDVLVLLGEPTSFKGHFSAEDV